MLELKLLISAFRDDEDQPLIISTPLLDNEIGSALLDLFSLPRFEVYFFDELNREIAGYRCDNSSADFLREIRSEIAMGPLDPDFVRNAITFSPRWFGLRSSEDDSKAMKLEFVESIYPDNAYHFDLTKLPEYNQGEKWVSHMVLEREIPGYLQEMEILSLLRRTFPVNQIFLNPMRSDQHTELADVVVIASDFILLVQAKDSPNTKKALTKTLERKKKMSVAHLKKALAQTKGAVSYLKRNPLLKILVGGVTLEFDISHLHVRCLVVVKELFDDHAEIYADRIVDLVRKIKIPCLAFEYGQLNEITGTQDNEESFFAVYDEIFETGLRNGVFPRARFGLID